MESKNILVVSAIGGGKTQVLFPIVEQVKERTDRMIIYDPKGDYTEAFGEDLGVAILSPFDSRGLGWDIGKDVSSLLAADEFAAGLPISEGEQSASTWSGAAREVIKGVIKALQDEHQDGWDFSHLNDAFISKNHVIALLREHYPQALDNFASEDGNDKQTSGVFLSIRRGVSYIEYLAKAWTDTPKLSLLDWIRDESHPVKTIILRGSDRYDNLSKFVVSQIFNTFYGEILSISDSYERRIWTFNDELGDLPKMPKFQKASTKGRSKGLRIVAGIQSIHQIKDIYGDRGGASLVNSFNTLLAGRVGDHETAKYLASQFGTNKIEKISTSTQENSSKISHSYRDDNEAALLDSDFLSIPNPTIKHGALFWLRMSDWPAAKLRYPIVPTLKRYPALIEKSWLRKSENVPLKEQNQQKQELFTPCMRLDHE